MIPPMKAVQTMARAYQQICTGEEPWIALGNFRNAWYGYAKDDRFALVKDPIQEPEPNTRQTRRWGAFCAASVEFLCHCYNVPCPEWVRHHPDSCVKVSSQQASREMRPSHLLQRI